MPHLWPPRALAARMPSKGTPKMKAPKPCPVCAGPWKSECPRGPPSSRAPMRAQHPQRGMMRPRALHRGVPGAACLWEPRASGNSRDRGKASPFPSTFPVLLPTPVPTAQPLRRCSEHCWIAQNQVFFSPPGMCLGRSNFLSLLVNA